MQQSSLRQKFPYYKRITVRRSRGKGSWLKTPKPLDIGYSGSGAERSVRILESGRAEQNMMPASKRKAVQQEYSLG
jgi:hypothetical protein